MRRRVDHAPGYAIVGPMLATPHRAGNAAEPPPRREGGGGRGEAVLAARPRTATKKPSLYKVFLLNDDFTPMDFVVQVLEGFFQKTHEEAVRIMLQVHRRGVGLCGVYTLDVAETRVAQVMDAARAARHPLQCTMERE